MHVTDRRQIQGHRGHVLPTKPIIIFKSFNMTFCAVSTQRNIHVSSCNRCNANASYITIRCDTMLLISRYQELLVVERFKKDVFTDFVARAVK